ncbi:MAG TPA: hypothetical protein VM576_03755 [Xanthomonadaceae bacterium]|nr:hypothetical protein [Xanthomonadaceae bacterium]
MPARLLFVPVSGSAGSGEVQRCRLLAQALRARAPDCEAHFALASGTADPGFPVHWLAASPTRVPGEVAAAIRALRPAVVVFDGNARVESLRAARAANARTVLVSSRPSARNRGLRGRRMALLDEHWLVGAELLDPPGWRERWARWRHPRVAVRRFATLFAPPAPVDALRLRCGLPPDAVYAVVCTGGGRHVLDDGRDAAALFGATATALARHGIATVAVACEAPAPAHVVSRLPNAELMGLLAGARVALLAGGSLLVQALALEAPALAVPLQPEQAARVRWLAARGAVRAALPSASPEALADALQALAHDPDARAALRAGARALGLRNGLDDAVAALAALAGA